MELRATLGRLLNRVARRLGEPEEGGPPPSAAPLAEESPGSSRAEFEERLRVAVRLAGTVAAGQVRFLGLQQIRDSFGGRWDRLAEAVETVVRGIIEKRLADFEVYTRLGELQYVLVFPTLDEAAARLKCKVIADEILRRLLGEDVGEQMLDIATCATTLDTSALEREGSLIDVLQERLDADEARQDMLDRGLAASAQPAAAPVWSYAYRPIWDTTRGMVSTFRHVVYGGVPHIGADEPGPSAAAKLYERDARAMTDAAADLGHLLAAGTRLVIAVTVHYTTLATSSHRANFQRICRNLPDGAARLIVFELAGVPDGIPQTRLVELNAMLKPFSRAVLLRLPLESKLFKPASEARYFAVGVDLGRERLLESELLAMLPRFVQQAGAVGLQAYLQEVPSRAVATAAAGAGFAYLDGDCIQKLIDRPTHIYRLGPQDVIQHPAAGR